MIKKDYKDLKFIDDFIFCKILSTNPKLCKELIELILAIKIKDIKVSESQKVVNQTYDGKGRQRYRRIWVSVPAIIRV